jgi:hypothetical protein
MIWGFLGFSNKFHLYILVNLMLISYFYKIICNLVTIVPSALAVGLLKKYEYIPIDEFGISYTPFSWEV